MKKPTKDLFDESTMTFGEHLEVLRKHLILALMGLVVTVVICLYQGDRIVDFLRRPIDRALQKYGQVRLQDDLAGSRTPRSGLLAFFGFGGTADEEAELPAEGLVDAEASPATSDAITVQIPVAELARALHAVSPEQFPDPGPPQENSEPATDTAPKEPPQSPQPDSKPPQTLALTLRAPQFAQFQATVEQSQRAVTLNVQEAFTMYVKVSLVAGLVLASPWIFYQLWLFVAAGLYPHERKYVYVYGCMSLVLFLVGAVFCYYAVFPFVLDFLLGFNATLKIHPQIRLSEWITFAVVLPLCFGISFQLPLVMLFLERISIFQVDQYRQQRRMAILVIAILSMVLTPAEPVSMILMMVPLILLYELGILLCQWLPSASPFDEAAAA